jgi:hypothetical protein
MWVSSLGVTSTRSASHAPESTVSCVKARLNTDNARISQTSLRRAAGHTAESIASSAVSGANTMMKWFSKMWAGSPLTVVKHAPYSVARG